MARLREVEIQARASAKLLEKEIADLELKLLGMAERERILREKGDASGAASAAGALQALGAQRDLARKQLVEATASAARAARLREERKVQGEDLATQTVMTNMQENLAGIQAPFDATDPAATVDEMRARLARSRPSVLDDHIAEADAQLQAEQKRAQVDDALAKYKQMLSREAEPPPAETSTPPPSSHADPEPPAQEKTLGRSDDKAHPVD
jgi:hypothetical protein